MKDFGDLKRRRRELPEDEFIKRRLQEHKKVVDCKNKLWAKNQPERWKDLDPWESPEIFAVSHALQGTILPDLIDELGEEMRKAFLKKGVEIDPRKLGVDIIVPLLWRFAGATLKFPEDKVLSRCMREALVWMEVRDSPNAERDETIRTLALRYDTTPGQIQKIFQKMSAIYGGEP